MTSDMRSTIERVHRWCVVEAAQEEMRDARELRRGLAFCAAALLFVVVCVVSHG